MWIFNFYRLYCSLAAGLLYYFFIQRSWWQALLILIAARAGWFGISWYIKKVATDRAFNKYIGEFKEKYGPYGIRMANKAENNRRIKESLAEIFVADMQKLKKNVEQLDVMDTLFNAGMRPEGDEYLLHDLKLKYGKERLAKAGIELQKD
ncbi:MAG: hypothetical protein GF398_12465 [Chitinivibrionales bacterium]|nr:hypothetical protein [Chitinivibrionales bacterium]